MGDPGITSPSLYKQPAFFVRWPFARMQPPSAGFAAVASYQDFVGGRILNVNDTIGIKVFAPGNAVYASSCEHPTTREKHRSTPTYHVCVKELKLCRAFRRRCR